MALATLWKVFAFLLISTVQQTKGNNGRILAQIINSGRENITVLALFQSEEAPDEFAVFDVQFLLKGAIRISINETVTFCPGINTFTFGVGVANNTFPEGNQETGGNEVPLVNATMKGGALVFIYKFKEEGGTEGMASVTVNGTGPFDLGISVNKPLTFVPGFNMFRVGVVAEVDEWTEWANDGTCSTTCGSGSRMQSRTRNCNQSPCCPTLTETRTIACQLCSCPVISQWTEWADDGTCSVTCGSGSQMQSRTRDFTQSTCCTTDVTSSETRSVACDLCSCPVSIWSRWSGSGRPNRKRRRPGWRRRGWKRRGWRRRRWLRRWLRRWQGGYGG